jgi:hypothetical protein
MEVRHAVIIERSLEEVWGIFDDPKLLLEWQDAMVGYKQLKGKPDKAGSVSLQTIKRSSGDTELTVTLLERKAPSFSKSRYEGMQLPFTIANSFSEVEEEITEWSAVIDVKLNIVQKAIGPMLKGSLSDLAQQNGDEFKAFVESR